jgi:biotin transport system substrate-specific component
MSVSTSTAALQRGARVPLRLDGASLGKKALFVALGTLVLAAASWIEVPMVPVPMTMQTYAIVLIGALCGWRLAGAVVLAYLGEAVVGLPVLSGGASGPIHFVGPTAGYLIGFPLAAMLVGWLAEKGWTRDFLRSSAAMLLGHAVILGLGVAWLAALIGWQDAVAFGLTPFLVGTVLKSALAVATVHLMLRRRPAGSDAGR